MDTLLKTDPSKLSDDCYSKALKAAVEKNNRVNAEKLILLGAKNIGEAIESAKRVDVKLMLLMVKAVLEDNHHLLTEIKNIGTKAHTDQPNGALQQFGRLRNPRYAILYSEEMTEYIANGRLRTRVLVKLAIKQDKSSKMLNELMLMTNIDVDTGSVGWSNLHLTELDVNWIMNLREHMVVTQLNLSQNQLSTLPISIASHIGKCTKLDLHQNNIKCLPASILELPSIKELNLSHNKISELPNVLWSASLIQLNLSYNKLKTLPSCATQLCVESMKVLRLEHNHLEKVPSCICLLSSLKFLDISYNPEILVLPADLGQLKELKQLVHNGLHRLYDPPPSVCGNSATCMSYLKSHFLKQGKLYHMNLIVIGKENVGKTTMISCLQGRQHSGGSVDSIEVDKWSYRPSLFKPTFYFNVWDFTRSKEYFASHQVFLSKRSLYLAVWNVLDGEDGIAGLKTWIDNIIMQVPESQIIIVATHLDKLIGMLGKRQADVKCDVYWTCLTQAIPHDIIKRNVARILFTGLKGNRENISGLKKEIYKVAENCTIDGCPIMGSSIPANYEKVNNKLFDSSVPILRATEIKEMAQSLGQPCLHSSDEFRAVKLFLCSVGSLLHFDEHRHNLNNLYFVKPQWLCKLMSRVLTLENEYLKDGISNKLYLKQMLKQTGKDYSEEFLEQCFVLLNLLEITLPLDKQGDLLLIPYLLSSKRPVIVDLLNKEYHYQRQLRFCDAVIPHGLWSRLLSRLMNTIAEVKNLISHEGNQNGELYYWNKGLYCRSDNLLFVIESSQSQDVGICIVYSFRTVRSGLLSKLVDLVQQVLNEWFPGLKYEHIFCCYGSFTEKCNGVFRLEELLNCIEGNKPFVCEVCCKTLDLRAVAPELLLDDIDPTFILDINSIHCNDNMIWSGRFGKFYRGDVHSITPVIAKFYDINQADSKLKGYEIASQRFRAEVSYLQKMQHPCLVGMIGVCKYPNIALVMEDGPMGSLDSCILKELHDVPRIVVYRIAAQITSALHFLHSMSVIHHGLTISNVLVWSLSLDDLVNCKLAALQVGDTGYVQSCFTDQFIDPEASKIIYDQRVDIYFLGIVFLQMMQRSYPTEYRQSIPELETPLIVKSISILDSELNFGCLAKKCCSSSLANRPNLQEVVEELCDPVFQLVMDVTTFDGSISCTFPGCRSHTKLSSTDSYTSHNTKTWISFQCMNGSEIIVFSMNGAKLKSEKKKFVKGHKIRCMLPHGNHVWATSLLANHKGVLLKFTDDEYIEVPIKAKSAEDSNGLPDGDYGVSLACSDDFVYVGTASGWCLMFPADISSDSGCIRQIEVSDNFIRSLILVKKTSLLWVSSGDQILFVNITNLEFDQDRKRIDSNVKQVAKLLLSPNEEIVWTVNTNGHSISAWNAHQQKLMCQFNSCNLLDGKIDDNRSRIVSASAVLDTLWVGLISGHILVVSTLLPQTALTIVKPYDNMVEFLVPIYKQGSNESMIISIGKECQLETRSRTKKQKSVDIVLWEVVDAKHMLQINYLSTGNTWLNDASVNKVYWHDHV